VCAATGLAQSFNQLLGYRAAEGARRVGVLPSLRFDAGRLSRSSHPLARDGHPPDERLRRDGGRRVLAGFLGERFGWRAPFWILGLVGMAYAGLIIVRIIEPARDKSEGKSVVETVDEAEVISVKTAEPTDGRRGFWENLAEIFRNRPAVLLLVVFAGANFVASVFLTWLTDFVFTKFHLSLLLSALISTLFPLANMFGALGGGALADWGSRWPGGRIRVQAIGLILGVPFVFMTGVGATLPLLFMALIGVGLCKGLYGRQHLRVDLRRGAPSDPGYDRGRDEHRRLDRRRNWHRRSSARLRTSTASARLSPRWPVSIWWPGSLDCSRARLVSRNARASA